MSGSMRMTGSTGSWSALSSAERSFIAPSLDDCSLCSQRAGLFFLQRTPWYTFAIMAEEDNARALTPETVQKTIELGRMLLQFGLTTRVTHHEDGQTLETDTTHTVMLGIMACAFAQRYAPHLDRGKIAQYALVHDLAEVYALDTSTYGILSAEEISAKENREAAALERIRGEFASVYPWITDAIDSYERLDSPEAKFVKVVDKVLPKIVHILNQGATARSLGHDWQSTHEFIVHQYEKLSGSYGADQPEAMELLKCLHEELDNQTYY
jgi:putative hydrolase of HD superfamily